MCPSVIGNTATPTPCSGRVYSDTACEVIRAQWGGMCSGQGPRKVAMMGTEVEARGSEQVWFCMKEATYLYIYFFQPERAKKKGCWMRGGGRKCWTLKFKVQLCWVRLSCALFVLGSVFLLLSRTASLLPVVSALYTSLPSCKYTAGMFPLSFFFANFFFSPITNPQGAPWPHHQP